MKIYIIGLGMGTENTLTIEAKNAIESSDIVIGSERLVKNYKNSFCAYKPQDIKNYIDNCNYEIISVLFSGDTGFYSGAEKLTKLLSGYDVSIISGISSYTYFCGKLGIQWQDVRPFSLHGRTCNYIHHIKTNRYCFFLTGRSTDIEVMQKKLCNYNMENVILYVGENLSYESEKISRISPRDNVSFGELAVVITENPTPKQCYTGIIDDSLFIRDKVPMTKSAVRSLSVSLLGLEKNSVIYDVGAGTGSVSVEMALASPESTVYAIEKDSLAIDLIQKNKKAFAADNIVVIKGEAPWFFDQLPAPTHVFIGGSGGKFKSVTDIIFQKNPRAVIVANAVSLETVGEITKYIEDNNIKEDIMQIQVSNAIKAGSHRLMKGENPIYIFRLRKEDNI